MLRGYMNHFVQACLIYPPPDLLDCYDGDMSYMELRGKSAGSNKYFSATPAQITGDPSIFRSMDSRHYKRSPEPRICPCLRRTQVFVRFWCAPLAAPMFISFGPGNKRSVPVRPRSSQRSASPTPLAYNIPECMVDLGTTFRIR